MAAPDHFDAIPSALRIRITATTAPPVCVLACSPSSCFGCVDGVTE